MFAISNTYELEVIDNTMEPLARKGQKVVVDPDAEVKSGCLVVFKQNGTERATVFRRYVFDKGIHQFITVNNHLGAPVIVMHERPLMRKAVGVLF